ncbi:hypothetical protein Vadar_006200 [Vaccinium darrowii]|uniref:Uncharacterized protein n=1 Tax=Vaccinium darrowii TaxID=229202 RepID=A0ACB7X7P2_9ERIC|nr:hypothetical protein Vadar_006200 [Vaccinium darrowii]
MVTNETAMANMQLMFYFQGKRVQKCVETLDVLKVSNARVKHVIVMFATLSEALENKERRSMIRLFSHQLLARRFCRNGTVFIICNRLIFGTFLAPATTSAIFAEELITGKGDAILQGGGFRAEELITGKGDAILQGGGFREFSMKDTHCLFSWTRGCPGNREAMCPSGPKVKVSKVANSTAGGGQNIKV